jgi:hypothetical protein
LANCTGDERRDASKRYQGTWQKGYRERCEQLPIEKVAVDAAAHGPESAEPGEPGLRSCFTQFPDLKQRFNLAFSTERAHIVATTCTYERGLQAGEADASSMAEPRTEVPGFCDSIAFGIYDGGYAKGWRMGKDAICTAELAYQEGLSRGETGLTSNDAPPPLCPSDRHDQWRQEYAKGLLKGTVAVFCDLEQAYQDGLRAGESGIESSDYKPDRRCPEDKRDGVQQEFIRGLHDGLQRRYLRCRQAGGDDCSGS